MFSINSFNNQQVLGANPFAATLPNTGGLPANLGGASVPVSGDQFVSSLGGLTQPGFGGVPASDLQSMGVSNSTLMLMTQINTMMATVTTMLMGFLTMLLSRQSAGGAETQTPGGGSPGGGGGSPAASGPMAASPGGRITELSPDREERIRQVVAAAKRTYPDNPVLAKLAVSQAILESGLLGDPSSLAEEHNNLFGIKGSGTAGTVNLGTQEEVNGNMVSTQAGFAKNATLEDSFAQHRDLLNNDRYAAVRSAGSLEEAAREVRAAGYATDSSYAQKLIDIYNDHVAQYFA